MVGNFSINAAKLNDLPQICEILNHAIEHTTANYDYEIKTYDYILNWYNQKIENNMPIIVAQINNQVLGFGTYDQFRQKYGYRFTMEHSLYVHPNFQKQGVGTAILSNLIAIAKTNNIHSLIAGIDKNNEQSIQMHLKIGFSTVGLIPQAAFKFNTYLDLQFLQKLL